MSTRGVRVMLEWFGRRQTIALPINSVVGCLIVHSADDFIGEQRKNADGSRDGMTPGM
jgi:hypothetical protein